MRGERASGGLKKERASKQEGIRIQASIVCSLPSHLRGT